MPNYYRLHELQHKCWNRGHKKWAKALGEKLREFREANPNFKTI